jgi:hypothetical protein
MTIGNEMPNSLALQQLIEEDAVGQLRRHDGLMAVLGSEDGTLKLDWVEGIERLLEDDLKLEEIEAQAREIWERGIRHIIWAGMGGSIIAVRVMADLSFCSSHDGERVAIYPLDSTDPQALNAIGRKIAWAKDITLSDEQEIFDTPRGSEHPHSNSTPLPPLGEFLSDVMMIGVSMGMTSEEPITHLTWFSELLEKAQLLPREHLLVMTLPGSYLELFAHERQVPSFPLQLDGGTGTGGRMSAPTTRVFLLPAALFLTRFSNEPGQLRAVLRKAWEIYDLALATTQPTHHASVQLAAALSDASTDGPCRMLLKLPEQWRSFVPWIEQLMEESLAKGGKGVIVFDDQTLDVHAPAYRTSGTLWVRVESDNIEAQADNEFILFQPSLANQEPLDRLAALAAGFLGWQLTMALYGYLHRITFAGQPAVENYKSRARALRNTDDSLTVLLNWQPAIKDGLLTLFAPHVTEVKANPALIFAQTLHKTIAADNESIRLGYLDLTMNGEPPESLLSVIDMHMHTLGNELLGIPLKLRRAPAAYHSTEQSEMDGPSYLVSLRLLMRNHSECILGTYTGTFLNAQAVSTWQAMLEQGRTCFLLIIDASAAEAVRRLNHFFQNVEAYLRRMLST